jgi:hypothetical protein
MENLQDGFVGEIRTSLIQQVKIASHRIEKPQDTQMLMNIPTAERPIALAGHNVDQVLDTKTVYLESGVFTNPGKGNIALLIVFPKLLSTVKLWNLLENTLTGEFPQPPCNDPALILRTLTLRTNFQLNGIPPYLLLCSNTLS